METAMNSKQRVRAGVAMAALAALAAWSAAVAAADPAQPASGGAAARSGCGAALPAGVDAGSTSARSVAVAGSSRSYLLHVPAGYDKDKPTPLVLNFHGFMSNPEQQNAVSGFVALSDHEGFILVTPDGGIGWRFGQSAREANTAFVRDLVAELRADLCVDPKRIFAAGKSQGGFMSSWLGCMAPELIAAIAPVSGIYEPPGACAPIPIVEFHGSADSMVPFGGGRILVLGKFPGAIAVMDEWARVNGCSRDPAIEQVTPHVRRATYPDCKAATVQYITDAGHTWPGTTVREGDNTTPADLPASQLIWDFFKTHPKP
jgi:polyhydroxybutyrate depolymerase